MPLSVFLRAVHWHGNSAMAPPCAKPGDSFEDCLLGGISEAKAQPGAARVRSVIHSAPGLTATPDCNALASDGSCDAGGNFTQRKIPLTWIVELGRRPECARSARSLRRACDAGFPQRAPCASKWSGQYSARIICSMAPDRRRS